MTTKRTHRPCSEECQRHQVARFGGTVPPSHLPDCPSLYSAQQEPDALTRLVRHVRAVSTPPQWREEAIALIAEAREEQRKAWRTALEEADAKILGSAEPPAFLREHHPNQLEYEAATGGYATGVNHALDTIRAMLKDSEP